MAGWSELPKDLLRLIAKCLVTYTDQVRFTCVCTSWRSILPSISKKKLVQPWLLLPRASKNEKYEKFYSLHEQKVHYLEVPEVLGKKFRGSSNGWLVSIEDSPRISLFNPITRVQIPLPPRYKFPDVRKYCAKKLGSEYALEPYYGRSTKTYLIEASHVHEHLLSKLVLSSGPMTSNRKVNFMVAAIYGSHSNLAYCKLGDKKWTSVAKGGLASYDDAIFHEEKLYAVSYSYEVDVFELSAAYPKKVETIEPPPEEGYPHKSYLVSNSIGYPQKSYLVSNSIGLLLVIRYGRSYGSGDESYRYRTTYFNLYMYEPGSRSWCKVENIGENVLFLGLNTSVSIASSYLAPSEHYKGNRIYFTDNDLDQHMVGIRGGHDVGFYDLGSRNTKYVQFKINDSDKYWKWLWPTPIWYIHKPEDFIKDL